MKRILVLLLVLFVLLSLVVCNGNEAGNRTYPAEENIVNDTTGQVNNDTAPRKQYVGEYEKEPVYQKLMDIETCKDPDALCQKLFELYGKEFSYVKMVHKSTKDPEANEFAGYEPPYEAYICNSIAMYDTASPLFKAPISTDTYLFFMAGNEEPSFIMDCDATYIVRSCESKNYDDGTHVYSINSWVMSDLFMCLHGYIDEDEEEKNYMREAVRYMDWYLAFENLVVDSLNEEDGNITKTESLSPSIEILSVEIEGPTMHELNVKYKIKNISNSRGVVYLTCSGHAYQGVLHFNDGNFKNDYREDGCFEYDVYYGGTERPVTFTIFYGYGEFDAYKGWDNEQMTTITFLFSEDYGEISSSTISVNEIYPLYFESKYVGAWTIHESQDLIEINGNSTSVPFAKNNTFRSENGDVVSVELSDGKPQFTINSVYVGAPTDFYEYDGRISYDLLYNEYFSICRYPNDEYIRIQNAWSLLGEGDVYLYPQ